MKQIILFFACSVYSMIVFSQSQDHPVTYNDYKLLKEFLLSEENSNTPKQKNNPLFFFVKRTNQWNTELSNNLYGKLRLDMKKEFAPALRFDNRFVAQSIPASYGSQNYQWVPSSEKYNLGKDIAGSVIGSFLGIKTNTDNKGYYTPSGIKY